MNKMVNVSESCRWKESTLEESLVEQAKFIEKTLKDAKVNYISELIGKPVEVEIDENMYKSFRILTEVL